MIGVFFSLFLVVVIVIVYLYWFFKKAYSFFDDKCFPTLQPTFILGNLEDVILLRKSLGAVVYDLYEKLKPYKYAGLYWLHRPFVMIRDAELVKNVLVRDFDHFPDRGIHCNVKEEPLNNNMLRMGAGDQWKNLRTKITPSFTSGKLKMILGPMQECATKLSTILIQTNGEPFDMKELSERFSMDVIGSCAFGMDTLALGDSHSIFLKMGKGIFKFRYQPIIRHFFPHLSKFWLKLFDLRYLDKEVESFFLTVIKEIIKLRENSPNNRNDLLDLLLELKTKNTDGCSDLNENEIRESENLKNGAEITMDLIIAQCYLFFAAGFETSSSAFAYLMMELALNQSIQNKVREEIIRVLEKSNGQITHDDLKEMTYCDMVLAETLRRHPPAGLLFRECSKTYQIPNTKAIIPNGTPILISIYGLHHDPLYYEKPNEFYPEHFTEEAKRKRPKCCYMPFGEGPRICIGERFAKLEVKIGMINIIKDFILEVSPKMKFPLEYSFEMNLGLLSAKKIWLQCRKI